MNVDGTNKRIIIKGAGAGRVTCWSPDGTKFIYYREDHPNAQLKRYRNFVFDIKSEQATRLEFPENESVWDWSPDGKELLTATEFQEEPGRQMFRVNFDGSNRVRLSTWSTKQNQPLAAFFSRWATSRISVVQSSWRKHLRGQS
jgi:Tol biopolymer transport system component